MHVEHHMSRFFHFSQRLEFIIVGCVHIPWLSSAYKLSWAISRSFTSFVTMASRLAPVPEERRTEDGPAEWLRLRKPQSCSDDKNWWPSPWNSWPNITRERILTVPSTHTVDRKLIPWGPGAQHWNQSTTTTTRCSTKHTLRAIGMMNKPSGYAIGRRGNKCPARASIWGNSSVSRINEPPSMVILYFLAHRHATEDEIKLYRSITLQFLVWSVVVSTSITQKRRTVKLAFLRGSFGPIWTFNLQGNFGPFFWPSQISNFWAIQFSG